MAQTVHQSRKRVSFSNAFFLYAGSVLVSSLLFSFLLFFVHRLAGTDDVVFPEQIAPYESIQAWTAYRYAHWSGRIFPEIFVYIFSTAPLILWKLATFLVYVTTSFSLYALYKLWPPTVSRRRDLTIFTVVLCFPFVLNPGVLFHSTFWVTGSMNYFWVTPFLLTGFYPLAYFAIHKHMPSLAITVLALVCAIIAASSQEQAGAVLVAASFIFSLSSLLAKKVRKAMLYPLVFCSIILIAFLVQFLAPGNYVRIEAEVARWLPDLHSLSLGERALHSLRWTFDALINHIGILLASLCITLLALFIRKPTKDRSDTVFMVMLGGICAILLIKGFGTIHVLYEFYPTWKPALPSALASFILIPWSLALLIVAAAPSILYRSSRGYLISLLILACFGATLIVTFSPTVYISGLRTLFMPSLLLFIATLLGISELLAGYTSRLIVIASTAAIVAVNYFLLLFVFLK